MKVITICFYIFKTGYFLIIFHLLFKNISEANENLKIDNNKNLDWSYVASYGTDFKNIIFSPSGWDSTSWAKFAGIIAVTGGLFFADKGIMRSIQRNRTSFTENVSDFGNIFGEIKLLIPGTLAGYLIGELSDNDKVKRVSLLLLKSIIITGGSLEVINHVGHRHRPDESSDSQIWDGPSFSGKNLSFPSGHSAVSFSIATILASEFSDYKYLKPLFFTISSLTALSRLHKNRHWSSDVFIGSVLGYYMGSVIAEGNPEKNTSNNTQKTGLQGFSPIFNKGSIAGLSILYSF